MRNENYAIEAIKAGRHRAAARTVRKGITVATVVRYAAMLAAVVIVAGYVL